MKENKKFPLLADGSIDFSKVDIGNDFRDFPPLYSTPEDIEKFIRHRNLYFPVLENLLKFRKENLLDLTPTENKFYFEDMFSYIYDVYRVPVEKTYIGVTEWLKYLELELIHNGFSVIKLRSFEHVSSSYETRLRFNEYFQREFKLINYFIDIGETNEFYNSQNPTLIESFWIKCDRHTIQPINKGEEAYARVHVYPERVLIIGCDDSSYTLYTKTIKKAKAFAQYLKCAAPVWNFNYNKLIHENLEFTN